MYARVFGEEALQDNLRRWDWQYRRNPQCSPEGPEIWIARVGSAIVGQYATMPVCVRVAGRPLRASWGMDVMVDLPHQRRGIGADLFQYWNDHVDVSLGLGLSDPSHALFKKLRWADLGPVPCYVKILTGRGLAVGRVPRRLEAAAAAIGHPLVSALTRGEREFAGIEIHGIDRFDAVFDDLWHSVADNFDFIVERDAAYLNWKFLEPPHVRYDALAATRAGRPAGYLVYRVARQRDVNVGLLVDWLTDPDDEASFGALSDAATGRCRAAGADKMRAFTMHRGFGRALTRRGFKRVRSTMEFCVRINDDRVPALVTRQTDRWHVTLGDADQDR